jgi:hypothetical protein
VPEQRGEGAARPQRGEKPARCGIPAFKHERLAVRRGHDLKQA